MTTSSHQVWPLCESNAGSHWVFPARPLCPLSLRAEHYPSVVLRWHPLMRNVALSPSYTIQHALALAGSKFVKRPSEPVAKPKGNKNG